MTSRITMKLVAFDDIGVMLRSCKFRDGRGRSTFVHSRLLGEVAISSVGVFSMRLICTFPRLVCMGAFCFAFMLLNRVQATTWYFDTNGTTTGSGITAAGAYSWESAFWNSTNDAVSAAGTAATTNWTDG